MAKKGNGKRIWAKQSSGRSRHVYRNHLVRKINVLPGGIQASFTMMNGFGVSYIICSIMNSYLGQTYKIKTLMIELYVRYLFYALMLHTHIRLLSQIIILDPRLLTSLHKQDLLNTIYFICSKAIIVFYYHTKMPTNISPSCLRLGSLTYARSNQREGDYARRILLTNKVFILFSIAQRFTLCQL